MMMNRLKAGVQGGVAASLFVLILSSSGCGGGASPASGAPPAPAEVSTSGTTTTTPSTSPSTSSSTSATPSSTSAPPSATSAANTAQVATVSPPTAAAPATAWRFALVGDTHVPASNMLGEMATAMVADGVKLALFAGDITESGAGASASGFAAQLAAWKTLAAPLYRAGIGVYPIRGNHENDARQSVATWNAAFSGSYQLPANGPVGETNLSYSFTYKNALFVGLDEYVNIHRVNQPWLDQQFAANQTQPHVFVFGHEPAFKVFHTDNLDDFVAERDTFWKSLARSGARTYFSGHDHFFDVARLDDGDGNPNNDVYQVVVGTGGGDLFDKYNYVGANSGYTPTQLSHVMANGYLLVELSGETEQDLKVSLTFKQRTVGANRAVSYVPVYSFGYTAAAKVGAATPANYPVVDTGQTSAYNTRAEIAAPAPGPRFLARTHSTKACSRATRTTWTERCRTSTPA